MFSSRCCILTFLTSIKQTLLYTSIPTRQSTMSWPLVDPNVVFSEIYNKNEEAMNRIGVDDL